MTSFEPIAERLKALQGDLDWSGATAPDLRPFFAAFRAVLFPHFRGGADVRATHLHELHQCARQLAAAGRVPDSHAWPDELIEHLPALAAQMYADARWTLQKDPAAHSLDEIIIAYPGFAATVAHRIAHQMHRSGLRILPRIVSEYAHEHTGVDIHPAASIGSPFCIDHGTGVIIGETTVVGSRVTIYQGVTLGALSVRKESADRKRHPTIEDDVVIYANATILGGSTVVGRGSTIGGNVWLTRSVAPGSIVVRKPDVPIEVAAGDEYSI